MKQLNYTTAKAIAATFNYVIKKGSDGEELQVYPKGGGEKYFTDDPFDALATAQYMALDLLLKEIDPGLHLDEYAVFAENFITHEWEKVGHRQDAINSVVRDGYSREQSKQIITIARARLNYEEERQSSKPKKKAASWVKGVRDELEALTRDELIDFVFWSAGWFSNEKKIEHVVKQFKKELIERRKKEN